MGAVEGRDSVLSETEAGQSEGESLKLVPVAESIRYRKRAQVAEKKVEALAEELTGARLEAAKIAEKLTDVQIEQELTRKLAGAGSVDLEAAVLIAKAKIGSAGKADLDGVVEQLKREKQYLFADTSSGVAARKTSGARERIQNNEAMIERAAKKAAATGSRRDLHEYLKLRRNFI